MTKQLQLMPVIRQATIEDADRIAEIHVAAWRVAYRGLMPVVYLDGLQVGKRQEPWSRLIGEVDAPVLVACEGEPMIGFCHIADSRDADVEDAAEIIAIYVDPTRWRRGAGKALCAAALTFALEKNYPSVTLWVLRENESARRFYEALGFRPDGAMKQEMMAGFVLNEVRYRLDFPMG